MADSRGRGPAAGGGLSEGSIGALLDGVSWDYDPDLPDPSPLEATERYFRDFPWEPEEVFAPRRTEDPQRGTGVG